MLRRASATGNFAAVARRGHEIAGAIFIKMTYADRRADIYAAAPGPGTDEDGQPRWIRATGDAPVPEADADAYLSRRAASDPDIWIIDIETRDGTPCVDGIVVQEGLPPVDPLISSVFRR